MNALESLGERLRSRVRHALSNVQTRSAAVLVPLLGSPDNPTLLLCERSTDVLEHKGEICFPGGSIERHDRGAVDAALREAQEELALSRELVSVVGLLDDVETTVSNYTITPVVGYVEGNPTLVPDPLEVSRILTVPIMRLLEPGVEVIAQTEYGGVVKTRYSYMLDGNKIWGATARIVHSLLELLRD